MRKIMLTLCTASLMLGVAALQANAQSQSSGAAGVHALIQNATPIATKAACRGYGPHCPPGWTQVCDRWHCWCRPCV